MSADFDKAIDGAVREMLDVAPRADLGARVTAQLAASGSRDSASGFRLPAAGWVLGSIAAVAVIVLAVFVARRGETVAPAQGPIVAHADDRRLPPEPRQPIGVAPRSIAAPPQRIAHTGSPRPGRVEAAAADGEDVTFRALPALSPPPPIDVARLDPPALSALPAFAPEPMTIRALEVTAIPETPRERR